MQDSKAPGYAVFELWPNQAGPDPFSLSSRIYVVITQTFMELPLWAWRRLGRFLLQKSTRTGKEESRL